MNENSSQINESSVSTSLNCTRPSVTAIDVSITYFKKYLKVQLYILQR